VQSEQFTGSCRYIAITDAMLQQVKPVFTKTNQPTPSYQGVFTRLSTLKPQRTNEQEVETNNKECTHATDYRRFINQFTRLD